MPRPSVTNHAFDRRHRIAQVDFDYTSQAKDIRVECDLCGGRRWTILSHEDRYGFPARTMSCMSCSLTILNPRMTRESYRDFYGSAYRLLVSAFHGRTINAETIKEEQESYATHVADLLREIVPEPESWRTMLDIGGSTGTVARVLATQFRLEATVLDPSASELAEAQELGLETIEGFVEEWSPDGRTFGLVGMFQTVDHLLDVNRALMLVRQAIRDDGVFLVDIVDFRAAYLRAGSVEAATKIDHPYFFTQLTIEALLQKSGFAISHRSYSPDHLHIFYVCRPADLGGEVCHPGADEVKSFFSEVWLVQNASDGRSL